MKPETISWLLKGDPSIRWQVQRDLLNTSPAKFESERRKIAKEGWGARLLSLQDADGKWGGGIYGPKWTSTTYTMLTLKLLGLPPNNPQAKQACKIFLDKGIYMDGGINFFSYSLKYSETCVTSMILALLAYFRYPDEYLHSIASYLIDQQMPDGGWNCESYKGATHSSFHTTISALEGLYEYQCTYPEMKKQISKVRERGHEFLLAHRLYKSHRTGKVFDAKMTTMPFPPRWKYDFIRALDYFRACDAPRDERMSDAIELLRKKQKKDGLWPMNSGMSGLKYFDLEAAGQPSRWNTLRALRVLNWWNENAEGRK
ncbi:MAG: terpene cyclase/mutase family protein [Chloroflexi bacterium]|nr:terpene cyclase/mutase family protein [Chloroflexota bacterium]